MSAPQTPGSGSKPEKTMSSRLLTMKFMQRAAASSSTTTTTPTSPFQKFGNPSTPKHPLTGSPTDASSSKRQKLSNGTPHTFATPLSAAGSAPGSNLSAISAALDAEQRQQAQASRRQAREAGETEWVIKFKDDAQGGEEGLTVNGVRKGGYYFLSEESSSEGEGEEMQVDDANGSEEGEEQIVGRRTFGSFKRKRAEEDSQDPDSDSDSLDASQPPHEPDSDSDDPTASLIRQARLDAVAKARSDRKAKKRAEQAESARLAQERSSKRVNLNKLTSISGGGTASVTCHICGEKGHMMAECPRKGRREEGWKGSQRGRERGGRERR